MEFLSQFMLADQTGQKVKYAIEFGAKRIGHGVRSYKDPEVKEQLKSKNIPLEMCPTSNRQTHAVEDMSKYPFMDYLKQGIKKTNLKVNLILCFMRGDDNDEVNEETLEYKRIFGSRWRGGRS